MKKILPILALVTTLAACKTKVNSVETNKNMVLVDTTGLYKNNVLTPAGNNKFVIAEKPDRKLVPVKNTGESGTNNYSSGTNTTANASLPQKQDKGWSHAAKATAIGGGTGAILGAVLNKDHRVGGAIVGGVIGAGTGYAIGRTVDKKTGRVARTRARKNNQ